MTINLKEHIKRVNSFDRANIAIIASDNDAIAILRNLFNIEISTINLKKKQEVSKDINIHFKEVNNFDAKQFDDRKLDCVIYSVDCISKRIDKKDIKNIIELQNKNTAFVCTLNNVEFLDLRELNEMKSVLVYETNKKEILSLFSFKNDAKENEWTKLYEFILNLLDDGLKRSFLRSQTVDVSVKKEISYGIITSYVDVIDDADVEMLDEKSIEIIIDNMIYDIAKVYSCDRQIIRTFKEVAKEFITSLVITKRGRLERLIQEENERLREEENERLRKEDEERYKKEEEDRLRVEIIKKVEEEKLRQEKIKQEEARKKEEEYLKKKEEQRKLEQEKLKMEGAKKKEVQVKIEKEKIEAKKNEAEKKKIGYENLHSSDSDVRKKSKRMKEDLDEGVIIEAIFSVDDVEQVQVKENTNDFDAKIDKILDEIIARKLEVLGVEIKKELKEKLRDNNII